KLFFLGMLMVLWLLVKNKRKQGSRYYPVEVQYACAEVFEDAFSLRYFFKRMRSERSRAFSCSLVVTEVVCKDEELPLSPRRFALPRLSPALRRASRCDVCVHRYHG